MYPEDRVLVAVVSRKKDLRMALTRAWYRVPQTQMPVGIAAEYLALYLSKAAARGLGPGGIYYYARVTGYELARRGDLLPDEPHHPRAAEVYYQMQFKALIERKPPILNPARRSLSFIHTTWDRFNQALVMDELYSRAGLFVDRMFYALPRSSVKRTSPHQRWRAQHFAFGEADPGEADLSWTATQQKQALLCDLDL